MSGLLAAKESPSTTIWPGFDSLFFGAGTGAVVDGVVVFWFDYRRGRGTGARATHRRRSALRPASVRGTG